MEPNSKGMPSMYSDPSSNNDGIYDADKAEAQQQRIEEEQTIDNPVGQFLEDAAVGVIDYFDQGRDSDQIRSDRAGIRVDSKQERLELTEDIDEADGATGVVREGVRAVAGGLTGAVEGVANTVDWTADLVKQQFIDEDEDQNVFSQNYEAAAFDLGIAENQTAVGGFAREAITMLTLMRGARAVPGVGAIGTSSNAGLGARLGGEAARGAIADMINDAGDGNFSNMLEEINPELKDSWITALSHKDDDNIFIRKVKNAVEGGLFGLAVDGIGELYTAVRAGRAAKAAGKTTEEAVEAAIDARAPRENGAAGRGYENSVNSAVPGKRAQMWDPNERAGKTVNDTVDNLIDSQDQLMRSGNPSNAGAKSFMDGELIKYVVSSKSATQGLKEVIRAAVDGADLEALQTGLRGRLSDDGMKTFPIIDQYIKEGNKALEELIPQKTGGSIPSYMTPEGGKVVRALIYDTAEQLNDLAEAAIDVADVSGDTFRQSDLMIDNLRTLLRFDKLQAADYGSSLLSRKDLPLRDQTLNEAKLAKQLEEVDKGLVEMKGKLQEGDPEAIAEFKTFTDSLLLADGDPEKMLSFWQMYRKVGSRNLQSSMYNGYLSSPKSQTRNVIGGLTQATLRPLSQAIGFGIKGQFGEAKAALGAFHSLNESFSEAFSMARKSWKSNGAKSDAVRIDNRTDETRKILEVMKQQAKTPAEKFLATQKQLEFDLFNNDWVSWPSRGLTAMDDAMRTLSSRMIMKSDVYSESFKNGAGFRFDADRYAEMLDRKIGLDGEILDSKLLAATKNITFQEDLTGFAKYLQDGADNYPVMKFFLPFIKTPTNMLAATMDYVPGWNRVADRMPILNNFTKKYRQVMKGSDESAKAIYRGREAIGIGTVSLGASLALTGNLTGNGPQDPEKRRIWEKTHQRNSIKIGGKWVSYESIEPLNTILSASADLAQMAFAGNAEAYDRSFAQLSYTLAAAITQKSYFQGLIQATKVMDISGGQFGNAVQDTAAGLANMVLPLSSARRALGQALAPGIQEWQNEWEKDLANALPGYANVFGSNRIDVFTGEPLEDQNDNIFNLFLPFNVKAVDNDPVVNFLSDSGVSVSIEVSDTLKGLKLTDEQKTKFQKYMADYGLHKNLERLIGQSWFEKDHSAWKESGTDLVEDERWYRAVKAEFSRARKAAAQALMQEDPIFASAYKQALKDKQNRQLGVYIPVKPMVSNPASNRVQELIEF